MSASVCHFCRRPLDPGAFNQKFTRSARQVSKHRIIPARYADCCPGAYPGECVVNDREAERAAIAASQAALTSELMALIAAGDTAGALARLQAAS